MKKEHRESGDRRRDILLKALFLLPAIFLFSACATTPKLPPPSPRYVYNQEKAAVPSSNSLWSDAASLYEDNKARRLNDLVTIVVKETIKGSGTADTKTGRDSNVDMSIDTLFGVNPAITGVNFFGKNKIFSPSVKGSMKNDFKGSGETTREGELIGTITAKVVEVMDNGNLVLESRKDITINREKQILVLRGVIRPDDVASDNTVLSSRVADAQIYYVGDGVIQDKQGQGWLVRILDKVYPF